MNTKNNSDDISLRLLDELDKESTVSQRALTDRLGISLGLVNTYIKRLCKKGYIKVKFLPRNRIKYMLTPQGLTEKTRLTYKYMHYSIIYFKRIREKLEKTYEEMTRQGITNILLWGDGELAELCYISTRGFPIHIIGVIGKKKVDKGFFGQHVYTMEELETLEYDAILVSSLEEKVIRSLQEAPVNPEKVFYLEQ